MDFQLGQRVRGKRFDIYGGLEEAYVFSSQGASYQTVGLVHPGYTIFEMLYYVRTAIEPALGSLDPDPKTVLLLHEYMLSFWRAIEQKCSPIELLSQAESPYPWETLPAGWERHVSLFVEAAALEVHRLRDSLYANKNKPLVLVPVVP